MSLEIPECVARLSVMVRVKRARDRSSWQVGQESPCAVEQPPHDQSGGSPRASVTSPHVSECSRGDASASAEIAASSDLHDVTDGFFGDSAQALFATIL